jgi:hypothetical protein
LVAQKRFFVATDVRCRRLADQMYGVEDAAAEKKAAEKTAL